MKVASILAGKGNRVITTRPDAPVATAVRLLRLERIGALVVSEDQRRVLGLVSEREIVYGLALHGAELLERPVSDIMIHEVTTCSPDESLTRVMAEMTRKRIRHLPVVENGRLAGIVSIGDVVKSRLDELALEANVLRDAYLASH